MFPVRRKKSERPSLEVRYDIDTEQYGSKTGNRLFIPVNIFRDREASVSKERIHDIYLNYGYYDIEEITFVLPEGYEIEALPPPVNQETSFGNFQSTLSMDGRNIKVVHQLKMKAGKYPKEQYEAFAAFNKTISQNYNNRIILRKTSR